MKIIFLLLSLLLVRQLQAQNVSISSNDDVYSPEEIYLLQQLSKRHLELMEKQALLDAKEKALNEKEAKLNAMQIKNENIIASETEKKAKIYMQLPISKAINLLNDLPEKEVADILSALPNNIASRFLAKMPEERIKNILENMTNFN